MSASLKIAETATVNTGLFYEYSKAANPIRPSLTPPIQHREFPARLYAEGPTRIVPLDMSKELKCASPATGPGLCANFLRILKGESLDINVVATSLLFYVIRGSGKVATNGVEFAWKKGDFFTAPGGSATLLDATEDAALYHVTDAPLLTYLGVDVKEPRFRPTFYPAERANAELEKVASEEGAESRSRVSVLLGAEEFPLTRTITHVLWAMYGMIGAGTQQKPHRHQSIALDLISDCDPGCYTLLGRELDADGNILNPDRVDWHPGGAFVTPPGYWHAHFNESSREARLIPIQDAGLQTYLRTLDIRFS